MRPHPSRNNPSSLLLLLFSLLVLLAGSEGHAAGFRLVYSNDNLGELDGCG